MAQAPDKTKDEKDLTQPPNIQYINRLQKMFYNASIMASMHNPTRSTYKPLRFIIYNFPPEGKAKFKTVLEELFGSPTERRVEKIYSSLHDWAYKNIFEQVFGIKPFTQEPQIEFEKVSLIE